MLYQPKTRIATAAKRALGIAAGILVGFVTTRSDAAYLDGMRVSELEDLGLRRSDDGGYRFFK